MAPLHSNFRMRPAAQGLATPSRLVRVPSLCSWSATSRLQLLGNPSVQAGLSGLASRPWSSASQRQLQVSAFWRREAPPPLDPDSPEQVALRASAGWQRSLSFCAFWLQLALSVVSAGVLLFALAATNAATAGPAWPRYLTAGGVASALVSAFFAHGFLRLARTLAAGGPVSPTWLNASLLRCSALNVAGIAATVIGLQASVGTLVAKSLLTSVQAPFSAASAANALVSLDVFSLQAATNTLLSHVVSLVFVNLMLRATNAARAAPASAFSFPGGPGGVALGPDGMSPLRPASLGFNPWTLKAD